MYATGARLIAVPGCPLPTFSTASAASTRAVLTAASSSSFHSSSFSNDSPFCGEVRARMRTQVNSRGERSRIGVMSTEISANVSTASSGPKRSWGRTVKNYVALTKPRVMELLLVVTVPAMILANGGLPNLWLVLATLIGGAMSAGSAGAFNCYIDREADRVMKRTKNRPLVTREISDRNALIFAWVLGV